MSGRAIVAALGHAWLRDESFGLKVLEALGQRTVPHHVDVADWSFGTITAFQRLTEGNYTSAVFVASAARGRDPGVLYRHAAESPLPSADEIHARICDCAMGLVSLDNLLIMARFYRVLPQRVMVIEAEPVDDTWGDDLSPTVAALVPQAVAAILAQVTSEGGRKRMSEPTRKILIAALGATLRGDDGFGPKLLARISRRLPPSVCGRDFGTHGLALVQALFERFDVLMILDACRRGGRPGTVYTLRPAVIDRPDLPSAHLTGPAAVLSLASDLGVLPPDVWLIGCEPADVSDYRRRLSRPVRRAMPHAAHTLCALIGRVAP